MSDLAERSKVNLDLWNLFIAIVSLGKTYEVRIMTKASTVFKKISFSKNFSLKCIRKHTKSRGHRPSGSGEEDF